MTKKKHGYHLITAFLIFILATPLQAGILIEPFGGAILQGTMERNGAGDNRDFDHNGFTFGGRLGYSSILGPMFGFQYDKSAITSETTDGWTEANKGEEDTLETTNLGVFLGYELPVMLRLWGAYHFSSEQENQDSAGAYGDEGSFYSGTGYTIGIGYSGLPMLSLNAEYRSFTYDEWENSDGSTVLSLPDEAVGLGEKEVTEILLSVSFPIHI